MEITAIITALGGLVGVTQNFLELRSTFKELFKKEIVLNKAFDDLNSKDKKLLTDMHLAIQMGRDLTEKVYKKLIVKYPLLIILCLSLFILALLFIRPLFAWGDYYFIALSAILGYVLFTAGFPVPFKLNVPQTNLTEKYKPDL